MGNCLVIQEKVVKIVKPDGKILEYKAPITAQQVLSDFSGHAVLDSLEASRHLVPGTKLLSSRVYYLVTLPPQMPKSKKRVRFAIPEKQEVEGTDVVRIKLVVSKQELQEMLKNEGFSANDLISRLHCKKNLNEVDVSNNSNDINRGWEPLIERIPEPEIITSNIC